MSAPIVCTSPALRYHGGKFRLYKWIKRFIPAHRCYVEPFGGAAGVLIQKPPSEQDVYNDLDGDISNFFDVVRGENTRSRLIEALSLTPYSRFEFVRAFTASDCPVERARRTCIRAQMSFGSAGPTQSNCGFRIDTKRRPNTSMHLWAKFPDTIAILGARMSGVLVENRPAVSVMLDHDGVDTLHFVDPPYMHETRTKNGFAYRHEMSAADHAELIEALKQLKGMVILCAYDTDAYRTALVEWEIHSTDARASANRGTKATRENIWLNPACVAALGDSSGFELRSV